MENFNEQYSSHPKLELLKHFILEQGTYVEMKKDEIFSVQGKINHKGAYIKEGLFRHSIVDDRGNVHIVGYTSSGDFTGNLDSWINLNQPSSVTIEAACDSKIYYIPFSKAEKIFSMNLETQQIRCALAELSYTLMYHRLLDLYCKTTKELYIDLLQ